MDWSMLIGVTRFIAFAAKVIAGSICVALSSHAQSPPDESPLETRARDFARQVSTGRPEELTKLVREDFGGNLPNIPIPAHIGMLMSYWDGSRGLTLNRLEPKNATQALAIYQNALTGGLTGIFIGVEAAPPYRINAIWPSDALHNPLLKRTRSQTTGTRLSDRQIARDLRGFVHRLSQADVFSGVVALSRNGTLVFSGAYGESNKDAHLRNRLETQFNLASAGKMFTAVGIAQLVDAGKLSYEDSLSEFLTDFPNSDAAKKIRIKHLLSHTSGLQMGLARRPGTAPKSVDEMIALYSDTNSLEFEPGTGYKYSNIGYVLLGKVIEKASGEDYYDYISRHILVPAGMRNTNLRIVDQRQSTVAIGYAKNFDAEGHATFENNLSPEATRAGPHGGAYSTIADLLKFEHALRSGKLLRRETVGLLMSEKPELGAVGYGYGFDVNDVLDTAGHAGGFKGISNNIDFFRKSGWTAIVLSNYTASSYEVCELVATKMRALVSAAEAAKAD
jgi:CubicO group peptidase (beta-lactamase class C family)